MATLTEIRNELDRADFARLAQILDLFIGAAERDPEVLIKNLSKRLKSDPDRAQAIIEMYADDAARMMLRFKELS